MNIFNPKILSFISLVMGVVLSYFSFNLSNKIQGCEAGVIKAVRGLVVVSGLVVAASFMYMIFGVDADDTSTDDVHLIYNILLCILGITVLGIAIHVRLNCPQVREESTFLIYLSLIVMLIPGTLIGRRIYDEVSGKSDKKYSERPGSDRKSYEVSDKVPKNVTEYEEVIVRGIDNIGTKNRLCLRKALKNLGKTPTLAHIKEIAQHCGIPTSNAQNNWITGYLSKKYTSLFKETDKLSDSKRGKYAEIMTEYMNTRNDYEKENKAYAKLCVENALEGKDRLPEGDELDKIIKDCEIDKVLAKSAMQRKIVANKLPEQIEDVNKDFLKDIYKLQFKGAQQQPAGAQPAGAQPAGAQPAAETQTLVQALLQAQKSKVAGAAGAAAGAAPTTETQALVQALLQAQQPAAPAIPPFPTDIKPVTPPNRPKTPTPKK